MKQGRTYTKLILWLFLIAVVCYFGYYLHQANYEPMRTVTAIEYEAGSGTYTTGFVVRSESVIRSGYEITTITVPEGARVASGESIGSGYYTSDAQDRQTRIQELEHELEQLSYAVSYSSDGATQATVDAQLQEQLQSMGRSVARRDMNACVDLSAVVKGLVLRSSSSQAELAAIERRIDILNDELLLLREEAAEDTNSVHVSSSGFFSGTVDGYEDLLTPQSLQTLTVSGLENMTPSEVPANAVGRLIQSSTWYYVTTVDEALVSDVDPGDRLPVHFASALYDELPMTVDRVGEPENGKCVLVLSCDKYMQDVTLLREQSADVVFSTCSGLRVPKEAIRVTDDRRHGVYVMVAGAAEWKYVEILHDNGESYVVKLDKSSTENLWPGDEIIITAEELYDGKVIIE